MSLLWNDFFFLFWLRLKCIEAKWQVLIKDTSASDFYRAIEEIRRRLKGHYVVLEKKYKFTVFTFLEYWWGDNTISFPGLN